MHMVLNLLDNGIKYNKPGGTVTLSNEVKQDPYGQDRMIIKVSDTGIGIPDDARERIFDPFYTVATTAQGSRRNGPRVIPGTQSGRNSMAPFSLRNRVPAVLRL